MNNEASWRNVYVYFYDDDKDDLIVDCVHPLFTSLSPRPSFFVRHWLRGPHLRLRFHTTADDFDGVVIPAVESEVGAWITAHPSTTRLDEAALLPTYERLAEREREPGPVSPLYPDNSIQYLPYDRRIDVLGSEAAASMIEDFYVDTNELTFAMLEHIRDGDNSRLEVAIDLMWATAHGVGGLMITRGFVSYRSHSEGRIMSAADPVALRSFFEQQYRTRRAALAERLDQVVGTLDGVRDDVAFVREWVQAMDRLWKRAEPLIADGSVTLPLPSPGRWFVDELTQHSAFHRALASNAAYLAGMRTNLVHLTYRVITNCLYLHLTRLGVKPFERSLLGYLVADTVEERYGVSAVDYVTAS